MPQSEFQVRDTSHLTIAQLAEATNATFADYFVPISHTTEGFAAFCRCNSLDVARSVLLERPSDGRLIGLTMLAIRGGHGWCGGFGLTLEFRGQGLAAVLIDALISQARRQSLAVLHLEALVQNERALKTYERVGFQTLRELVILGGILPNSLETDAPGLELRAVEPSAAWAAGLGLPPAPEPCWQRDIVSLLTTAEMKGLIARRSGTVVGVLLYRPNPMGLLSVGHLVFADEIAARALLGHAALDSRLTQTFVQNEPAGSPLHDFCRTLGLRETHRQYEMMLTL